MSVENLCVLCFCVALALLKRMCAYCTLEKHFFAVSRVLQYCPGVQVEIAISQWIIRHLPIFGGFLASLAIWDTYASSDEVRDEMKMPFYPDIACQFWCAGIHCFLSGLRRWLLLPVGHYNFPIRKIGFSAWFVTPFNLRFFSQYYKAP